jgi:hypothetical protein
LKSFRSAAVSITNFGIVLTLDIQLGARNLYSQTDTRFYGLLAVNANFSRRYNPGDLERML